MTPPDPRPSPPGLPAWALDVLRCTACGGGRLETAADALLCRRCGHRHQVDRGVVDGLADAHPAVDRERRAVAALDAGEVRLPAAEVPPPPAEADSVDEAHPCLRHVAESRRRIEDLLASRPLDAGSLLVELGADDCWASDLFLGAGCRVVAVDITDHLHLAGNAGHPDLCRLRADMNRLPLADGCADVVWATAAAHHSWDLGRTFREAARLLRPGGRLCFCCEPMPSWLRWPFGLWVGDAERALGINETWIRRRRWLAFARAAGLEPELVFPDLDEQAVRRRLADRRLPAALAPWLRPLLRSLQVSIHLLARRT